MKVLIVEDQPAVANALRTLFDVHDIETEWTANPDAAARVVELLADPSLPESARRSQALGRTSMSPVRPALAWLSFPR